MRGRDEIAQDEIDGVRVLWQQLEGPFRAQLLFGVGQAHEPMPWHGITHLCEHLVLSGSSQAPHPYNGTTGVVTTSFVAAGEVGDVVSHLGTVCRNLQQVPTERLEHERQVLRAEAAQRPGTPGDELSLWRWGPVGFGVTAYEELALRWVGAEQLHAWSTRFSADNAVLWLSQPPPEGLRLPLAPQGTKPEPPALVSPGWPLPGAFGRNGGRGVTFSLLGHRGVQAMPAMWLLQHRLEQRLRHERGLVYGVLNGTDVLEADARHFMFALDCLEENAAEVQDEVCRLLQDLDAPATDQEWETFTSQRALWQQVPQDVRAGQYLENAAQSLLLGRALEPLAEWEARSLAVTREEVTGYLRDVKGSLVLGVTEPLRVSPAVAAPLPLYSDASVQGRALRPSQVHPDTNVARAVVGREGASLVFEGGQVVTVRAADVAAVLCFDDGTRHLLGRDGFHLHLAPEQWRRAKGAFAELDEALPAEVRVPAGAREPSRVKHKRSRSPFRSWSQERRTLTWGLVLVTGGLAMLAGGNTDGGAVWPVVGSFVLLRWAWLRQRRRSEGGS